MMLKQLSKTKTVNPKKEKYINPIEQAWIDAQPSPSFNPYSRIKYENGMLISISNNRCQYETVGCFKEIYISIIKALTDYNISRWSVQKLVGCWDYGKDKIQLPSREKLLDIVIKQKNIIMIGGVHNYKKDDIRSEGREYCHSHLYLYNIHHHLPLCPVELARTEAQIRKNLNRYTNVPRYLQGTVRITEVGIGQYSLTDYVTPTKLYDYLRSPIDNPDSPNVINYIANNRHLPNVQYPLTTVFHK